MAPIDGRRDLYIGVNDLSGPIFRSRRSLISEQFFILLRGPVSKLIDSESECVLRVHVFLPDDRQVLLEYVRSKLKLLLGAI